MTIWQKAQKSLWKFKKLALWILNGQIFRIIDDTVSVNENLNCIEGSEGKLNTNLYLYDLHCDHGGDFLSSALSVSWKTLIIVWLIGFNENEPYILIQVHGFPFSVETLPHRNIFQILPCRLIFLLIVEFIRLCWTLLLLYLTESIHSYLNCDFVWTVLAVLIKLWSFNNPHFKESLK